MPNDFIHGYSPPGVYIEETSTPLVGSTGLPPTLVAIVGPSVGYQRNSEQFTLATTAWRLAKKGVNLTSVKVTRIDTGAVLSPSDYTMTPTSSPSASSDYYVDIVRAGGGSLSADTPVFIEYQFTDPDFYLPRRFENYEDVKDAYGEPLNLTPPTIGQTNYEPVSSPISLAAKIAFENGAGELVLVATTPPPSSASTESAVSTARRNALNAAYAKIATNYDVNVVVPLTDEIIDGDAAGAAGELGAHINSAAADGFFRVGVLGFDPTITIAPDVLVATGGFRSKRMMFAFAAPAGMSYFNGGANQVLRLGHQYLAAAYGGRLATLPVQKPLTKEIVRSFSGISGTPLSNSLKNQYAAAGVAITEVDRLNQLVVRHGVTTDPTSLNTREMSVVRARDALVTLIQVGMDTSGLVGQPIDENTPLTVKGVVAGLLEHAVITDAIVGYTDLKVRQRSLDPSVIEVKFGYQPAYPLNYIVVSFSVNVATGETADVTENAA